jgi:hypothetical protein
MTTQPTKEQMDAARAAFEDWAKPLFSPTLSLRMRGRGLRQYSTIC